MAKTSLFRLTATCFMALAMAACGGGGSGGTSTPQGGSSGGGGTTTPPPVTAWSVAPVQSVPAATYAAGSYDALTYAALNELRLAAGAGLLAQDTRIDQAAADHQSYLIRNGLFTHYQDATKLGFTGINPQDRANYRSYPGVVTEGLAGGYGRSCIRSLSSSPYHLMALLGPYRDYGTKSGLDQPCVSMPGRKNADLVQMPPTGAYRVFPGPTDIYGPTHHQNTLAEFSPVKDLPGPMGGPVYINLQNADNQFLVDGGMQVTSFTLRKEGATSDLPAVLVAGPFVRFAAGLNSRTDRTAYWSDASVVMLIPVSPLDNATRYTATFVGTVNGKAVNKTWTYQTWPTWPLTD